MTRLSRWAVRHARRLFASTLVITTLSPGLPVSAQTVSGATLDLQVLLISTGTLQQDDSLRLMSELLTQLDVRHDVLDARNDVIYRGGDFSNATPATLTQELLFAGTRGFYNGVILTNAELYTGAGSGFTLEEWQTLHSYERNFGVRQSVMSGWPAINPALDLNYGLSCDDTPVTLLAPAQANWSAPAGGFEIFEYVNVANPLPITDYALTCAPTGTDPAVQPLLAVNGDTSQTLVSVLKYSDGREVLMSTVANAWFLAHSQVLAYEFLNFATKGLFIGSRQVHFNIHLDDLFLDDEMWDPINNVTDGTTVGYRMTAADVSNAVQSQSAFRNRHPTAKALKLDFAFNGFGADLRAAGETSWSSSSDDDDHSDDEEEDWRDTSGPVDPLTSAMVYNRNQFRFINHTYTHRDLDTGNPEATYPTIVDEVQQNRAVWLTLGLPDYLRNVYTLVTGMHSGLATYGDHSTTADDVPYPLGANVNLLNAARDTGVRYLAGDPSRPNQNVEDYVPGYPLILLPRWPTALFYNVIEPDQWTDEYNWVFHERHIAAGEDPCTIPGALCQPRTYQQILAAEADTNLRNLLSYKRWPYYMHQSNLAIYQSCSRMPCKTLLFDWMESVVAKYEKHVKLPLKSTPYHEIGRLTSERLKARNASIRATWNPAANTVTFFSNKSVRIQTTGLYGGALYGGQTQREVPLTANRSVTYTVDRALTR